MRHWFNLVPLNLTRKTNYVILVNNYTESNLYEPFKAVGFWRHFKDCSFSLLMAEFSWKIGRGNFSSVFHQKQLILQQSFTVNVINWIKRNAIQKSWNQISKIKIIFFPEERTQHTSYLSLQRRTAAAPWLRRLIHFLVIFLGWARLCNLRTQWTQITGFEHQTSCSEVQFLTSSLPFLLHYPQFSTPHFILKSF